MFFRKIIKSTIVFILYKYYNIKKFLKIIISCICTEYLYNVILRSAKKIEYESTIIGIIINFSLYLYRVPWQSFKRYFFYIFIASHLILRMFVHFLPMTIIENFNVRGHTLQTFIISLCLLSYNIIKDFIELFCK